LYGVTVLDGRQKAKARKTLRRFQIKPHSMTERSPLTFNFTDWEDAYRALQAFKLKRIKARVYYSR